MVASGLSSKSPIAEETTANKTEEIVTIEERSDVTDPDNSNIVTTYNGRVLVDKIASIIGPEYE